MGEVELQPGKNLLIIHADLYFYGNAASGFLSKQIARDIADHWNEPRGKMVVKGNPYDVVFRIEGFKKDISPELIFENINPRNNYFRIEEYAHGNISFVDGLG